MTLTPEQRAGWRHQFSERIQQAIDEAVAASDPEFLVRLQGQARRQAGESLGVAAQLDQVDDLKQQRRRIEASIHQLLHEVADRLNRPLGKPQRHQDDSLPIAIDIALTGRAADIEQTLLSESELGRRILQLRAEQDAVYETVDLVETHAEMVALWQTLLSQSAQQPTPLQAVAMEIVAARRHAA